MADIKRSVLFGKLNSFAYGSLESAAVFCKMRGNPHIEVGHFFYQLLQVPDSDLGKICGHFRLDLSRLARDLTAALDQLPRGSTSVVDFSSNLQRAVERGWVYASLLFSETRVRSGHVLVGLLKTAELEKVLLAHSAEFRKLNLDQLTDTFSEIVRGSREQSAPIAEASGAGGAVPGETSQAIAPAEMGKQEALSRFSVDLTQAAAQGNVDPIFGRDEEVRQIVDILMRRRQNNPILAGEAGVGKTAVVECLAARIAAGDVPAALKGVTLRTLDLGLLQAGASMKGEFENRLRQVIEEVQSSPKPIILFIDEAHTLIGAGGAAGTGDAANLLKPALARGTLRTIAATTWAEYKRYFEKDPALTRRFQVVKIDEPSEGLAVTMIRGRAPLLEKYYRVAIFDEALEAAARLSHRYIPSRQLPDKAVNLIETACVRVQRSQEEAPAEIEDCQRSISSLEIESSILKRESALGLDHDERMAALEEKLAAGRLRLEKLDGAWRLEKEIVGRILDQRAKLRETFDGGSRTAEDEANTEPSAGQPLAELRRLESELAVAQGGNPLIYSGVDAQAVARVISDWTGIPVGRMVKDEIKAVLGLSETLGKRIIGQGHALEAIAQRIQTTRAKLDNPNKPIGVFLLAGTSGVGKTETALALAEALYGGETNVITINMSEYQEKHTVSTLKGPPPGYVGYGEGGVLTEAVRRRPYSVVLLDEMEKAHPEVHEIFFQVFDRGWMEDAEGRFIDFKNTIILLTTNLGSEVIMDLCQRAGRRPDAAELERELRPELRTRFGAAFLGRLTVIPYYPLTDEMLQSIIALQLGRVVKRVAENHRITLTFDEAVKRLIASRCTEVESGGRMVDAILTQTLLPEISRKLLNRQLEGDPVRRVAVSTAGDDFSYAID